MEDDPGYNKYGELTRQGLDDWADAEGGLVDLFHFHGMNEPLDRDDPELLSAVKDYVAALEEYMTYEDALREVLSRDK